MTTAVHADPVPDPPHPFAYSILILPFGAMSGYVSVAMAFLCTRFELSVKDGALLIASGMFPHVWKFFWAPIADTTLTRKRWYLISCFLCAVGITAMSAIPLGKQNLHLLQLVIFIANLASTFLGMSVEGLMAHSTPADKRGTAGGWFQAGNLGGSGLGGGAGLWMATHLPAPWMSGAILGVCFLLGSFALFLVPEAPPETRTRSLLGSMGHVAVEFWRMIKTAGGVLCAVLCVLPINTGASLGVLAQAEVAAKWGATENTVSLVSGVLSGVVSAIGCLVAGAVCDVFGSRKVYAGVAFLLAMIAVAMALAPFNRFNYVAFSLVYTFVVGMSYAAFTGFVLDAIGKTAAATKYNAFASLSNFPIMYMGLILAWAQGEWGEKGMLFTEAGVGVGALLVLGAVTAIVLGGRKPGTAPAP